MRQTTEAFLLLFACLSLASSSSATDRPHPPPPSVTSPKPPPSWGSTLQKFAHPPPLPGAPGGIDGRHRPGHDHHNHRHGPPPIFFGSPFAYPYGPYYGFGPLYRFGPLYGPPYNFGLPYGFVTPEVVPGPIYAPFYCSSDGLAFTDEATFARHLHDAHGVPLANALSYAESIGGHYVFFGF